MSSIDLDRPDDIQLDSVADFFEDFREAYENCEAVLIDLEQRPKEQELLNSIFRVVHTIKGNLGFIGLFSLIPLLQSMEDVLDNIRKGQMDYDSALCDVIQLTLDRTKQLVEAKLENHPAPLSRETMQQICELLSNLIQVTGQTRLRHIRRVILLLDPEHNVDGLPADDENVAAPVAPTAAPTPVMAASARLLQHYGLTLDEDLLFFVSLAQALETRHTNWHGRTARQLFLCMEMNRFSGQKVDPEQLAVAVLLHDLGMSFLPSSVLDEHGQPDPAQRSLWERHSEHCAGMLASSPRWQDAAAMIWQHHEAVDGTGLPDQLAGDEIADGAKILAIADMFDARTNELGAQADGKRAMVKAVVEINHQIGKAFDEFWVGIFNQVIKQHQQRFQ